MSKRTKLADELKLAKSAYDRVIHDKICGNMFIQNGFKSPELKELNDRIDEINTEIRDIWDKVGGIRKYVTNRLQILAREYFIEKTTNVTEFKDGAVEFYIDGFPTVVKRYHLHHLYKDGLSGMITLTIDHCTETYNFKFIGDELYIERDTCIY